MFLEARIPFVIEEIMRKSYVSLLQTLFLTKSVLTLTSLPVTLPTPTVKIYEDEIFGGKGIFQFFSGESKK